MQCDEVTRWSLQATIWTCRLINTSKTLLLWTYKLTELYVFVLLIVLLKCTHADAASVSKWANGCKIKTLPWQNSSYDEEASWWKSFIIWRLNDLCEYGFCLCIPLMSAWNQASAPYALTTCIPAAGVCIVHTSYQLAQFKYFAVFKVLLNFSSAFSPDPFQMCEPQAKWGGSKLHTYVLIAHRLCVSTQYSKSTQW